MEIWGGGKCFLEKGDCGEVWGFGGGLKCPLPIGCGLWRIILKGWKEFYENTFFQVSEGSGVSFWDQRWCGNNTLRLTFPNVYRISCQKKMSIIQLWS